MNLENTDYRIYNESTDQNEQLKKAENLDTEKAKALSKTIVSIQNKLEGKFWNEWKEFFIRNMNDYLQSKYNARFDLIDNNGKKDIVLVIGEGFDQDKLNKLVDSLILDNNENKVFIDENKNRKKDDNEIGVSFEQNKLVSDTIMVSSWEIDSSKNKVGFKKIDNKAGVLTKKETREWKLYLDSNTWKTYYEVWNHGDYLAAPIRLFVSLSQEYFWWMSGDEIASKIKDLWVRKWENGYEFSKLPAEGFEKVWDFGSSKWKEIVKPHSRIDITSLQKALDIKTIEAKKENKKTEKKESKETLTTPVWWWRFYTWANWEVWDIPDKWENITYDGYWKDYFNLTWKDISIWAWNIYDLNNKNNKFSLKQEIDLWENKKWYLVVWETEDKSIVNSLKWKKDPKDISNFLTGKWVEAWFSTVEVWEGWKTTITIKEVWDPKVHVVTETSGEVDRWKDKSNPIILDSNIYTFDWVLNWKIEFKTEQLKDKNWAEKLEIWVGKIKINGEEMQLKKLKEDQFNKIFPWGKWYLKLPNSHVIEVSFDKEKWIQVKDLWEKKWKSFEVWGVKIKVDSVKWANFDKITGKVDFPKQIWWGDLDWKLFKWKEWLSFSLDHEVAWYNLVLNWLKVKDLNELNENIIKALLYLWTQDVKEWNNGFEYPKGIDVKEKTIKINIKEISDKSPKQLLEKLDIDSKISENFIMNAVEKNVEKKYPKIEWKKETEEKNLNSNKTRNK